MLRTFIATLLIALAASAAATASPEANVISVSHRPGDSYITVNVAIPKAVENAAVIGNADFGLRVVITYVSENGTVETIDSGASRSLRRRSSRSSTATPSRSPSRCRSAPSPRRMRAAPATRRPRSSSTRGAASARPGASRREESPDDAGQDAGRPRRRKPTEGGTEEETVDRRSFVYRNAEARAKG